MYQRYLFGFTCFSLSFALCILLQINTSLSIIQCSAISALFFSLIPLPHQFKKNNENEALFLAGSFAGMTSFQLNSHLLSFFFLAIFSVFLFFAMEKKFTRLGGKLGLVVFVSCALMYVFKGIL
jgi:hypothetical protein